MFRVMDTVDIRVCGSGGRPAVAHPYRRQQAAAWKPPKSNKDIDSRLFPPPFDAPGHAAYSRCYSAIPDMLMIIIIIIIDLSFAINWREAHLVAPRGPSQSQASGIITVHYKLVCLGDYRLAEVETTHPTTTYSVRADDITRIHNKDVR